jgi:ferredoxin-NADP reductase
MARTALRGRLTWQLAELVNAAAETPRVTTIVFDVPGWPGHRAGQHVDVRLTAPSPVKQPRFYACEPTPFVEAVTGALVRLGHDPLAIKTERFGPTGR